MSTEFELNPIITKNIFTILINYIIFIEPSLICHKQRKFRHVQIMAVWKIKSEQVSASGSRALVFCVVMM